MPTNRSRALATVVAAVLLLATACSAGGDDDAGTTTTSGDPAVTTTTTGDDDPVTTTEADDAPPADRLTAEDLEAILPDAAELGDGWEEAPADDEDTDEGDAPEDQAIEEQCPEAAGLGGDDDEDDEEVVRTFTDADGAEVEVSLSPTAEEIDPDELSTLVDALNDCGTLTVEGDDGSTTTYDFEAAIDDERGDQGLRAQIGLTLELPEVGVVELTLYVLSYRDGDVGVSISGFDGLDQATVEAIPIDPDVLVTVADGIDERLAELTGG